MISLATFRDHPEIIEVWEQSVRVTHRFLPEDYLDEIKLLLPSILTRVKVYLWRDGDGSIQGFAGVSAPKMEMLFIQPQFFGRNLGRQLTNFCIHSLNIEEVDVNEQNEGAIKFYEKMGYHAIGRDEVDGQGKPYPILHMRYNAGLNSQYSIFNSQFSMGDKPQLLR